MTRIELSRHIQSYVAKNPGVKAIQLIVDMANVCYSNGRGDMYRSVPALLDEMVNSGCLREEEYSDPGCEYRIKTRYYLVNSQ